jgi:hypothetical protein
MAWTTVMVPAVNGTGAEYRFEVVVGVDPSVV